MKTEKKESNIFVRIAEGAEEITCKAEAYLEGKEFLANDDVRDRIWQASLKLFEQHGGSFSGKERYLSYENLDWDALPWWAAQTLDGWMPYSQPPTKASLGHLLGYSPESQDAHLRNIMEIAEGRETDELDFPVTFTTKDDAD